MNLSKSLFYTSLFFVSAYHLNAQKHDYNWVLGDWFDGNGHNIINLNTYPPEITTKNLKMNFGPYILAASDAQGDLIFYSNGLDIRNRNDQIMKNSEGFNMPHAPSHRFYYENIEFFCYPYFSNTILFIPLPGHDNRYIIFHQSFAIPEVFATFSLYFTIIDMHGDEGMGEVLDKNVLLRHNVDGVALTKHANGKDWWIITADLFTNEYLVYLIDSTGVSAPQFHTAGPELSYFDLLNINQVPRSSISITPDGNTLIRNKSGIGFFVLDFDRSTGSVSFRLMNEHYYDALPAFSLDSRYMYNLQWPDYRILQYDLEQNRLYPIAFYYIGRYLLAPDGKVYCSCGPFVSSPEYLNFLCYINRPDLPGRAVDLHLNTIKLPKKYSFGLPRYPNYRLGAFPGHEEDSFLVEGYIYQFSNPPGTEIDKKYTHREFSDEEKELLNWLFEDHIDIRGFLRHDRRPLPSEILFDEEGYRYIDE